MDYISKLSNDVLSHILSRLPTKEAVKTCILSKAWEFKWGLVYNVDINMFNLPLEWRVEPRFTNLVERVLVRVQKVENLSLNCSCPGKDELKRIVALISAKVRMGVECLNLHIYDCKDISLHRSLLNCTSLINLDLIIKRSCSFKVPNKISLPHLKTLRIGGVHFINEISSTETVTFTFPVLEELDLVQCKWVKVKVAEFHVPSLRTFTSLTPYELDEDEDIDYTIKLIGGAMFSNFDIDGGYIENIILTGSTVASASIGCQIDYSYVRECGLQVRKLLSRLPNLTGLNLLGVLWAIEETKQELPLPRFSKLEKIFMLPFDGAEGLLELLHATPILKSLNIENADSEDYDYDSLEHLPSCVEHHLEEVTFSYDEGPGPNYSLEKFFLKRGAQLKNFFISTTDEIIEKLSMFPKASSNVKIMRFPTCSIS